MRTYFHRNKGPITVSKKIKHVEYTTQDETEHLYSPEDEMIAYQEVFKRAGKQPPNVIS